MSLYQFKWWWFQHLLLKTKFSSPQIVFFGPNLSIWAERSISCSHLPDRLPPQRCQMETRCESRFSTWCTCLKGCVNRWHVPLDEAATCFTWPWRRWKRLSKKFKKRLKVWKSPWCWWKAELGHKGSPYMKWPMSWRNKSDSYNATSSIWSFD